MSTNASLLPGRLLRRAGPPKIVEAFPGVQVDDPRLSEVLSPDAKLLCLYEGTLHAEGPIWDPAKGLLFWSDVANRRLLALHSDGHVEAALDGTYFMNGNALDAASAARMCPASSRSRSSRTTRTAA
jgi:gluconolactonase